MFNTNPLTNRWHPTVDVVTIGATDPKAVETAFFCADYCDNAETARKLFEQECEYNGMRSTGIEFVEVKK